MAAVRQIFTGNGSWVAPAGVGRVRVTCVPPYAKTVSYNSETAMATMTDGTTWSWGSNGGGCLGANVVSTTTSVSQPNLVSGGISFQQIISTGLACSNSYYLDKQGNLYSVGLGANGQLGNGASGAFSSPVLVVGGIKFAQIPSVTTSFFDGGSHMGAIDNLGNAWMFGNNTVGQLGIGSVVKQSSPTLVVGGLKFTQICILSTNGTDMTMLLDVNGNAWSFGSNNFGQLGNLSNAAASSPVQVVGGIKFKKLSLAGGGTAIGLDVNGGLWTWGNNATGLNPTSSPILVSGGLVISDFYTGGAPGSSFCVFMKDVSNNLYCYGMNFNGSSGTGQSATQLSSPTLVLGGLKWQMVATSNTGSVTAIGAIGLDVNGNVYGWGTNGNGFCGIGTVAVTSSPTLVLGGLKFQYIFLDAAAQSSNMTSVGITMDGQIFCWGSNALGQAGVQSSTTAFSSPVQVLGGKMANMQAVHQAFTFDVVPGTSYQVLVNPGIYSYFGTNPLLAFTSQVMLDYEQ